MIQKIAILSVLVVLPVGQSWGQAQSMQPVEAENRGQEAPPTTEATAAKPAVNGVPSGAEAILARVIEVKGDARRAGLDGKDWQPCKVGDEYPQYTQVITGLGGSVKFQLGTEAPYSVIVVEPVSTITMSELFKTATTKTVRIGLSFGKVRGGVAEGGLQSDFTVDTPVATLSKKGTWNFGMFYERATNRFDVFLLDRGLVEALYKITGEVRELRSGQNVTEAMRRWMDQAQISRNVAIADILGQGDFEVAFNRLRNDGLGILNPGGGREAILDLRNSDATAAFTRLLTQEIDRLPNVITLPGDRGPILRPEGFFGSGRGDQLIQIVIDQNNFLARNKFARPGTLRLRRSAAENWLKRRGR